MKFYLVCLFVLISTISKAQIIVIHKDAYDIKKHNLSVFFLGCIPKGAAPQIRYTYYPHKRVKLLYDFHTFINTSNAFNPDKDLESYYRPGGAKSELYHGLELDYHLIDFHKHKKINVALNWSASHTERKLTYTSMDGEVRRILAFFGGVHYADRNEQVNAGMSNGFYMYNFSTQKEEEISAKVYTNVRYLNVDIGLKFKSIPANGTLSADYGKKYSDMHLETYGALILPVYNDYLHNVFRSNYPIKPTHKIGTYVPKPGFKVGIFHRNSVKNFWCVGGEFGMSPTIAPLRNSAFYFKLSMGLSLNFGKLKLISVF